MNIFCLPLLGESIWKRCEGAAEGRELGGGTFGGVVQGDVQVILCSGGEDGDGQDVGGGGVDDGHGGFDGGICDAGETGSYCVEVEIVIHSQIEDRNEEMENTGTSKEREQGLVEIGPLPLSFTLAASGTLSGSCPQTFSPIMCRDLAINSDFTFLRLFKEHFTNHPIPQLSVRRELGSELEMAVVEMSLEQQVQMIFYM